MASGTTAIVVSVDIPHGGTKIPMQGLPLFAAELAPISFRILSGLCTQGSPQFDATLVGLRWSLNQLECIDSGVGIDALRKCAESTGQAGSKSEHQTDTQEARACCPVRGVR